MTHEPPNQNKLHRTEHQILGHVQDLPQFVDVLDPRAHEDLGDGFACVRTVLGG